MPLPARYQYLFGPELHPDETLRSAANADLWLRYRRLALTDRRLICIERGGVRGPRGGRRVRSIPLDSISDIDIRRNRVQTTVTLRLKDGSAVAYALPSFSRGTGRFCQALARMSGQRP